MPRIVYIGNDKWSVCLESIIHLDGLEIIHSFIPNESKSLEKLCQDNNLPFTKTQNINDNHSLIASLDFDFYLVIGHPFLLNKDLLSLATGIGFHPSLLPKRRGRAPINWAIIDGIEETGVSLFHLDEGVDSGNLIFQQSVAINETDTAASLIVKVSEVLVDNLASVLLAWPNIPSIRQDQESASYTEKRSPNDGEITTKMTAQEAVRLVRALNGPYPSAFIVMENGERLYINEASENGFD